MPAPLKSLWELRAVAAGAPAAVRVRNLRTTVTGPLDAWGRGGKPQPASISATVTFHEEFGESASTDSVASDTVHYGQLSKAILGALDRPIGTIFAVPTSECPLGTLIRGVWFHLTGADIDGDDVPYTFGEPFLKLEGIRTIEISVHLSKATLLGDGLSATQIAEFDRQGEMVARARALRFHELRVPTLIGVNDNERRAKQVVVASIEMDHLEIAGHVDQYPAFADKIVEIMSDSSFETLEALARRMGAGLAAMICDPSFELDVVPIARLRPVNWRLHISLEKPIAITLADAACVELNVWTRQADDASRLKGNKVKQEQRSE